MGPRLLVLWVVVGSLDMCEWQSCERWMLKVRILVGLEGCFCCLMENQKQRSTEDLFVWFCGPFLCFVLYVHACESWWLISDSELKGGTAFCRRIFLTILQLCCTDCTEKSSPPIKESVSSYGEMGTMACTPHITKCLSCGFVECSCRVVIVDLHDGLGTCPKPGLVDPPQDPLHPVL